MQSTIINGHGFNDVLPNGRASGQITIDGFNIRFESGTERVDLPLSGTEIYLGGASDRLVFFSHPSQPDWKLYTADRSVLGCQHLQSNQTIKKQLAKARRKRTANWSILASVKVAKLLSYAFALTCLST